MVRGLRCNAATMIVFVSGTVMLAACSVDNSGIAAPDTTDAGDNLGGFGVGGAATGGTSGSAGVTVGGNGGAVMTGGRGGNGGTMMMGNGGATMGTGGAAGMKMNGGAGGAPMTGGAAGMPVMGGAGGMPAMGGAGGMPAMGGASGGWQGPPLVVAVGYGGRHLTSVDGTQWINDTQAEAANGSTATPNSLFGAAYAGGLVVAVGGGCTNDSNCKPRIVTFDGATWKNQTPAAGTGILYGVAHGNDRWIAVGDINMWSTDGVQWHPSNVNADLGSLRSVAFGNVGANAMFVAVGKNSARAHTAEGVDWHDALQGPAGGPNMDVSVTLNDVAINNGIAIAVGNSGRRMSTADGVNWSIPSDIGVNIVSIVTVDTQFFAYANDGNRWEFMKDSTSGQIVTSASAVMNAPANTVSVGFLGTSRFFAGCSAPDKIKISNDNISLNPGLAFKTVSGVASGNPLTHFVMAGN